MREVPILFLFGINLPLKKYLMKSFFFILTSNCRQLLAPVVGLAEEEAEVGVCEVGSTLLDRACDLSL